MAGDALVEELELLGGVGDRHFVRAGLDRVGPYDRALAPAEEVQCTARNSIVEALQFYGRVVLGKVLSKGLQCVEHGVHREEALRLVELAVCVVYGRREGLLLRCACYLGELVQQ